MQTKNMRLRNFLRVCVVGLILTSCFKQSSLLDKKSEFAISKKFDLVSCGDVSLLNDLLKHKNMINLFSCLGWKNELPNLFKLIEQTNEAEWNFLTGPLEDFFLDNKSRRDRVLSEIIQLNNNHALDGVSNLAESFFESGILGGIEKIFQCAENMSTDGCDQDNRVSKENILVALQNMQLQKTTYKQLEHLLRNFVNDFKSDPEVLKYIYEEIVHKKYNKSLLIQMFSSYYQLALKDELTELDSLFVQDVFSKIKKGDSEPWIYLWIKKINDAKKLSNFLELVFIEKASHFDHIQNLNQSKNDDLICSASDGAGRQVYIDIKETLNNLLNNMRTSAYEEFTTKLILQVNLVRTSQEFCPLIKKWPKKILKFRGDQLEFVTHNLNFYQHLKDFTDILEFKEYWELFRFLTNIAYNVTRESTIKKAATQFSGEATYLLTAMSRKPNVTLVEILRNSILPDKKIYKHLSRVIGLVSPLQFKIVSQLAKKTIDINREIKDIALVLNSIPQNEKEKIFALSDKIFSRPNDILHYLKFFAEMVAEIKNADSTDFSSYFLNSDSKDLLYKSLRNLSSRMNDKDIQNDLRKFISKDYILRFVKILSGGIKLKNLIANNEQENVSLFEIAKGENNLELGSSSENDNAPTGNMKCLKMMLAEDYGLHSLLKKPISGCQNIEEFSSVMFQDFSIAAKDYHNVYFLNDYNNSEEHLFDKDGLFSPVLLSVNMSNLKSIDEALLNGSYSVKLIDYLDEVADFLFSKKDSKNCSKCLNAMSFIKAFFSNVHDLYLYNQNNFKQKFETYRNLGLREFSTSYKNLEDMSRSIKIFLDLIQSYAGYIQSHNEWIPEKENQLFSCKVWSTFNIGLNPCPEKKQIKRSLNEITSLLLRDNNGDGKTALYYLLEATHSDYGINIPYSYSRQSRYKLTLQETVFMLFDQSDKNYIGTLDNKKYLINKWPIFYRNINEEKDSPHIYKNMTTMDRIEVSIRDINFDSNYLGVLYENTVSKGLDYNYVVHKDKTLLNLCTKFRFCGRTINSDEKRLAQNALSSYDGLLHSNLIFGHGNYMQGLLTIFVASSIKEAQEDSFVKIRFGVKSIEIPKFPSLESLQYHNGKIIYEIASLAGFNNAARLIHSRIGTEREKVNDFINSKQMNILNNSMLHGLPLSRIVLAVDKTLKSLNKRSDGRTSAIDQIVDYVYDLSYEDQRYIETALFDLALVNSFLGSPSEIYDSKIFHNKYFTLQEAEAEFRGNNLLLFLENLSLVLDRYPTLVESFKDYKLIDIFKFINRPLKFVVSNLLNTSSDDFYSTYYLLNKSVKVLNTLLFKPYGGVTGFSLVVDMMNSQAIVKNMFNTFFEAIKLGDRINDSYNRIELTEFYVKNSIRAKKIVSSVNVSLSKMLDYFHLTTLAQSCDSVDIFDCKKNYHYDEPFKLLNFLATPSVDQKGPKIENALYKILERYNQQFKKFIEDILSITKLSYPK